METLSNQWVGRDQPLLTLVDAGQVFIDGLVNERNLKLLETGQSGVFIAAGGEYPALSVQLERVDISAVPALPYPELGSEAGGSVAVRRQDELLIPESAHYRVQLIPVSQVPVLQRQTRQTGMVMIKGKPRSALLHQLQRVVALFIRESGF